MKKMLLPLLLVLFVAGIANTLQAQNVALNNDGSAPDAKALLDVKSTTKGVLLPRMTATDMGNITGSVPLGLLVFQTDGDRGFYYNASALPGTPNWKKISNNDDQFWQYASPGYLFNNGNLNVGVGTATPAYKFTVRQDNIGITQESSDGLVKMGFFTGSAGAYLQTHTNHPLNFTTNNGAAQATLLVNGNFGIGTATPGTKLVVRSNNQGITQENADGTMQLALYTNPTIGAMLQTTSNHALKFGTNNSVPQATLAVGGNFGVGTETPAYKITAKSDGIGIAQESANGTVKVGMYTNSGSAFLETITSHPLNFTTADGGSQMQLSVAGTLGVGTQTPTEAGLVVDKKIGAVNAMFGSNTTGVSIESSYPGIGLNTYYNNGRYFIAAGGGGYIGLDPSNSRISFANSGGLGSAGGAATLQDKMYIDYDGTVSLGSTNLAAENLSNGSGYKLKVFGKAIAEEVRVQLKASWPDYVFKKAYTLMPLPQLEKFIQANNHLPNIPKAEKLEKEGTDLGEMQRRMMEKIEELTLYVIEQDKKIETLTNEVNTLKKKN